MHTDNLDSHIFLFVTGLHRSGTTLLHRCLREHPRTSGFHNTGVYADEGQHLQTILPRPIGGPGRFGRQPENHITETHPLACPETAQALLEQWGPYWDLSKPCLLEKSPPTLLRTRLFQALFPQAHFVVIVRHPAAVALATYNALASAGWLQDLTVHDLLEHGLVCQETFQTDAPCLRHLILVRYEDFAADPQSVLDTIYASLDLPSHPVSEEIRPRINASYLSQWHAMSRDPQHQADIAQAMSLEDRVRLFGYSLHDWGTSEPEPAAPILETERLRIRRLSFADVDDLTALYADPETARFFNGPRTREQVWGEITGWLSEYEWTGLGYYGVVHKADNRLIGWCGPERRMIHGRPEVEVGYMIARPYRGQGLATEASRGVREYAFANYPFERLISLIDPENAASIRVAEKNGLRYEEDVHFDGNLYRLYAINRPEAVTAG